MFPKWIDKVRPFRPIYLHVDAGDELPVWQRQRQRSCLMKLWSIIMALALPVTCLVIGLMAGSYWQNTQGCEGIYSPFVAENPSATQPRPVEFDARLNHPTNYGGPPSPEVDRLWMDLAVDYASVAIPEELRERAGLEGSVLMNRTTEQGSDTLETFAIVEVFHQLQCLDLLRKTAYPNYEYYSRHGKHMFHGDDSYELETRIGHCVDTLRQRLTCNPDYALAGYYYVEGLEFPVPNFPAVRHSCQDFTTLQKWTEERAVFDVRPEDLLDRADPRVRVLREVP